MGAWEVPPTDSPSALPRPWGPGTLGSRHTLPEGQGWTEGPAKAQTVAGTGTAWTQDAG